MMHDTGRLEGAWSHLRFVSTVWRPKTSSISETDFQCPQPPSDNEPRDFKVADTGVAHSLYLHSKALTNKNGS